MPVPAGRVTRMRAYIRRNGNDCGNSRGEGRPWCLGAKMSVKAGRAITNLGPRNFAGTDRNRLGRGEREERLRLFLRIRTCAPARAPILSSLSGFPVRFVLFSPRAYFHVPLLLTKLQFFNHCFVIHFLLLFRLECKIFYAYTLSKEHLLQLYENALFSN